MRVQKTLRAWLSGLLALQLVMPAWLIPTPALAAGETLSFLSSPRYVRQNNGGDIDAQVLVTNTADSVDFYIDGSVTPVSTSAVIAGAPAGYEWYRLKTPLAAGAHTLTAIANLSGGGTVASSNTGIVYSLDTPAVAYIIPSASSAVFRSGDNPLRAEVDDEFDQFNRAVFTISNGGGVVGTYTVNRAQCDLREAGHRVLCDVNDSSTWVPLVDGNYTAKVTTYTQANNRADNIPSLPFIVDNTRPVLSSFTIDNPTGVATYRDSITVSANATHIIGIQKVDFWVTNTESRPAGPVCTGNGTQLAATAVSAPDGDGKYRGVLATGALNGQYCLNAAAESLSHGHSQPIATQMVMIDNTVPASTLSTPSDGLVTNDPITISGTSTDNQQVAALHLYYRVNGTPGWTPLTTITNPTPGTPYPWTYDWTPSVDGTYDVKASAEDVAGNVESSAYAYGIVYDTTAPVLTEVTPVLTPANDPTPNYSFSSDEAGSLSYGGSCGSATTTATTGVNTIELTSLADGTYAGCTVTVTDTAGNSSLPLSLSTFIIDTVTPATSIAAPVNGQTQNAVFTINGTATDDRELAAVALEYRISGGSGWTPMATLTFAASQTSSAWTYDWTPPTEGTYDIHAVTTDTASNTAVSGDTPEVTGLIYDVSVPTLAILAPAANSFYSGVFSTNGTAGDTLSGINGVQVVYRPDGGGAAVQTLAATYNPGDSTWLAWISRTFGDSNYLADGFYQVDVTATDNAGNATALTNQAITVDGVAPVTNVISPTDGGIYNTPISIDGDSTDALSGVASVAISYRVSGDVVWTPLVTRTNPTPSATFDWAAYSWDPADGTYDIQVISTDASGNSDAGIIVPGVVYDTTAPTLAEVTPVTTPTNDTTPSYTFSSDEAGTITYGGPCSSATTAAGVGNTTITLTGLADGAYSTCTVTVTDLAGNASSALTLSPFTIDTVQPVSTVTLPVASSIHNTAIQISGSSVDERTGVASVTISARVSGSGPAGWATLTTVPNSSSADPYVWGPLSYTPPTNGIYDVRVQATDAAGNIEDGVEILSITYDTILPTGSWTAPAAGTAHQTPVTLSGIATDSLSGVDTVTVELRNADDSVAASLGATVGSGTWTTNLTSVADGRYEVYLRIVDLAGNSFVSASQGQLVIDTTAPVTTMSSPSSNIFVNSSLTISGTSTDAVAVGSVRLYYSVAGADSWNLITTITNPTPGTSYGWSKSWTPSAEGNYDIKAAATDTAGNQEHSAYVRNVTFDTTAPAVVETQIIKNGSLVTSLTVGDVVTVRARVTDTYGVKTLASMIENSASGKSLGSVTLTAVGNNWYEGPFTVPATYTDGTKVASADGRWTIGATDKAGNYTFSWSGFTVRPIVATTTATGGTTTGGTTGGQGASQPAEDTTTAASVPTENPQTLNDTPEVAGASTSKDEAEARNLAWLWWVLGLGIAGGAGYWFWLRRLTGANPQF